MPLFRRSDGALVTELSSVRRLMPLLMKGRNESIVYYEQELDLAATLPFVARWNEDTDAPRMTLFHVFLAALGRVFHERPGLNRFVSGGRIYERNGVFLSFAAKKAFDDEAPLVTVKLVVPPREALPDFVARVQASVGGARTGPERSVDREVRLATRLPQPFTRASLWLLRSLDRHNLAPGALIDGDPMYASAFVANLGSVGLGAAWHHLYEYGTVGVFAALGAAKKLVVVRDGAPAVSDGVVVRYAFDERINDGFYCASSLEIVRRYVEAPQALACLPQSGAASPRATAASRRRPRDNQPPLKR